MGSEMCIRDSNISQVSDASKQVADSIGNVQSGADQTSQASQMLKTSADDIAHLSDSLEKAVSGFLDQIRGDNVDQDSAVQANDQEEILEAAE